ncbi:uncharacterized protein [Amphiura filiformis]|uniref:uncharacterized protein n=1 Tax=Amphiura filiformis TaxID=82378 RepID=UPI003B20D1E5
MADVIGHGLTVLELINIGLDVAERLKLVKGNFKDGIQQLTEDLMRTKRILDKYEELVGKGTIKEMEENPKKMSGLDKQLNEVTDYLLKIQGLTPPDEKQKIQGKSLTKLMRLIEPLEKFCKAHDINAKFEEFSEGLDAALLRYSTAIKPHIIQETFDEFTKILKGNKNRCIIIIIMP